ncbi:MAG: type II toxin-antitoxin system HicB family antitoxin [Candidatus Scalindua sp. AMX11]|nr:MAG: type II toxin-antitoxin system HicB family antitoxin [Candidatus Scalindua sp.]RZV91400.1 MAG: type II toxin-antitoxin system HicB family antitoxin [Candidatus Scalindua sp. SCAELEC01]TDE65957.1 MAG: type II toxin-antitoxin system HicB family antitoxin [Candidatus Scalindua sp. AMX11]GJQ59264.1 MAG: DNA repair protein HhH-GPD [Candidatus Scalindua sp.]
MKDMIHYKGYHGSAHYSDEDQVFFGKIEYIRSLVNYEGTTVENLKRAFEEAVEDYLKLCQNEGIEPDQSFRRSFNVRTVRDLHRKAALYAKEKGLNLNKVDT